MALQTKTLLISAGHSMSDPGASGNGLSEADIVLDFRDRLFDYLSGKVVLARDGKEGQNLPLSQACEMAKRHDVAVEFHCNAFSSPSATGVETLSDVSGKRLGAVLCNSLSSVMGISNRGAKGEGSGQHSRLAFVRAGGIIVELFFITNPDDLRAFRDNLEALVAEVGRVLIDEVCTEYSDAA
uniref:N-acetylmuramoyl-L-alanine amidase n=1 Tax=Halomonas sp. TaxID=1486246 RepID=UPI002631EBD0|nr:N-acetylmuramoyl-L-alanine amidase [Halomonas sp.]